MVEHDAYEQLADDAAEAAAEIDTHCRQFSSVYDRFATCCLLTISICSEGAKNTDNPLKDWKTAAIYGMEINSDKKAKSSSTASRHGQLSTLE